MRGRGEPGSDRCFALPLSCQGDSEGKGHAEDGGMLLTVCKPVPIDTRTDRIEECSWRVCVGGSPAPGGAHWLLGRAHFLPGGARLLPGVLTCSWEGSPAPRGAGWAVRGIVKEAQAFGHRTCPRCQLLLYCQLTVFSSYYLGLRSHATSRGIGGQLMVCRSWPGESHRSQRE